MHEFSHFNQIMLSLFDVSNMFQAHIMIVFELFILFDTS